MKTTVLISALLVTGFVGSSTARSASGIPAPSIQVLSIVNRAGVSPYELRSVERAIIRQVNQGSRWWHFPPISFGKGGWPIYIVSGVGIGTYHYDGRFELADARLAGLVIPATPYAVIDRAKADGFAEFSETLDHEILEMLANPHIDRYYAGRLVEICDRVEMDEYADRRGVWLEDFVLPRWFSPDHSGRLDYLGKLAPVHTP